MKKVQVAIMGFGTVGTGIYRILTENHDSILHREQIDMQVKRILELDRDRLVAMNVNNVDDVWSKNIDDIVSDPDISIVFETMGGVRPAREFILAVLESGKTVVTSNKEVVAKHWPEFESAAKKSGAGFYIEATCGGGIPIIRTLIDGMQANNIELLMGIMNGTTNYILTKMTEEDSSYDEVLKEAQALGYAEANPAADVEGWDVAYKLSILGSIAFHSRIEYESIYREGIVNVSKEDIAIAKELGYVIKLLAIGKKTGGQHGDIELRVHPTMIPLSHPLASVRDSFNAIFMHGDAIDDVMLYGRGAGQMPTASAMVSDAIYSVLHADQHNYMTFKNEFDAPQTLTLQPDWTTSYCMRLRVDDQPGTLASITKLFSDNDVSIHSIQQRAITKDGTVSLVIITHPTKELSLQATAKALETTACVHEINNILRVEGA